VRAVVCLIRFKADLWLATHPPSRRASTILLAQAPGVKLTEVA
jgi:hypothetical protein